MGRKKSNKTGRILYVPSPILMEIEDIRMHSNASLSESWNRIHEHIQVGKEMERIGGLFGWRRKK